METAWARSLLATCVLALVACVSQPPRKGDREAVLTVDLPEPYGLVLPANFTSLRNPRA